MKHLIITILLTFVFSPIFACTNENIIGKWIDGNIMLTITADSLFWDEYTDTTYTELIEGDCFRYSISNDTISYQNNFDAYVVTFTLIKEENILALKAMNTTDINVILLNKLDINQKRKKYLKINP